MTQPRAVWFRAAPPPVRFANSASPDSAEERYATVDGRSWAVLQTPVLLPQIERPDELSVMPHVLLSTVAYRLDQHGAELPDVLRRAVLERDEPINVDAALGQLRYVDVAGTATLGFRLVFGDTQSVTTLFDNNWLVAVCPVDADDSLSLWDEIR